MDKQEWIDEACEWLRNNLPYSSKPPLQLIAEFREAMTAGQSDGDSSDPVGFESFWREYDKKVERRKAEALWKRLSKRDRTAAMAYLPLYKQAKPDKQFRKNHAVFLRNHTWEDELIGLPQETAKADKQQQDAPPPTHDEFGTRINAGIKPGEHQAFALLKEDLLRAWSRHKDEQNGQSLRQLLDSLELTAISDRTRCVCLGSRNSTFTRENTVPWFWAPDAFDRIVALHFNGYGWTVKNP